MNRSVTTGEVALPDLVALAEAVSATLRIHSAPITPWAVAKRMPDYYTWLEPDGLLRGATDDGGRGHFQTATHNEFCRTTAINLIKEHPELNETFKDFYGPVADKSQKQYAFSEAHD